MAFHLINVRKLIVLCWHCSLIVVCFYTTFEPNRHEIRHKSSHNDFATYGGPHSTASCFRKSPACKQPVKIGNCRQYLFCAIVEFDIVPLSAQLRAEQKQRQKLHCLYQQFSDSDYTTDVNYSN